MKYTLRGALALLLITQIANEKIEINPSTENKTLKIGNVQIDAEAIQSKLGSLPNRQTPSKSQDSHASYFQDPLYNHLFQIQL